MGIKSQAVRPLNQLDKKLAANKVSDSELRRLVINAEDSYKSDELDSLFKRDRAEKVAPEVFARHQINNREGLEAMLATKKYLQAKSIAPDKVTSTNFRENDSPWIQDAGNRGDNETRLHSVANDLELHQRFLWHSVFL